MTKRSRAREVALQLLFQHDFNTKMKRKALERFVRERLSEETLCAFCLKLYDGTLANLPDIDKRLSAAAENWKLHRMAAVDRNALRLGAYEVLHMPETPAAVVFDEAIELARRFGSLDSPSFVNGVLDHLHRNLAVMPSP